MSLDLPPATVSRSGLSSVRDRLPKLRLALPTGNDDQEIDESRWHLKYGGVVIAAIGFVLTRVTVLSAIHLDVPLVHFLAGDILPLVLGLGITVFGIGLAISTLSRAFVNTVAIWCLLGTLGMAAVAGVIVFQVSLYVGPPSLGGVWANSVFANTLLGGAIGGILIGVRSATNHRHRRELKRQSSQVTILNRYLRHEVLNKLTVIQGYTAHLLEESTEDTIEPLRRIQRSATQVQEAIDDVGFLARLRPDSETSLETVRLTGILEERVAAVRETYPEAEVVLEVPPNESIQVRAGSHLPRVFEELLKNAIQHNDTTPRRVRVSVTSNGRFVAIHVVDNGPGLPEAQRSILEDGILPTYDDPSSGFGLPMVRMLVSQYQGTIEVNQSQMETSGTDVRLTFSRGEDANGDRSDEPVAYSFGIDPRHLGRTALAALSAGVAMGVVLFVLTDTLPAIGGLYGVQSPGVGWVLHLFHSVVFGLVFAAALSRFSVPASESFFGRYTVVGLGYGVVLWAGAAGIVMPIWLNLVGISTALPFLTLPSLLGHTIWGGTLGALYGYLVP